jgi:hypothetical protein
MSTAGLKLGESITNRALMPLLTALGFDVGFSQQLRKA